MDEIHFPVSVTTSMKKGQLLYEAKAGCGKEIAKIQPRGGSLLDVGLSGWTDDITCPPCRKRLGLPERIIP